MKYYFYKWWDNGTDQIIHDLLRWQVRERQDRSADPSLVVLDAQSVHAAGRAGRHDRTGCEPDLFTVNGRSS
ncbi:hypothetical protein [Streptomyces vietnamensis]|uniref:hypothetical protein n=1 Tax=Streptomyces vietnamensis TaxID=362257 RepID=UPI003F4CCFC9